MLSSLYFKVGHTPAIFISHLNSSYCLHTSLKYLAARIISHYLSLAKNIIDVSLAHRLTLQSFQPSLFFSTKFITFPEPQIRSMNQNVVERATRAYCISPWHKQLPTYIYLFISPLDRHNNHKVLASKWAAGF